MQLGAMLIYPYIPSCISPMYFVPEGNAYSALPSILCVRYGAIHAIAGVSMTQWICWCRDREPVNIPAVFQWSRVHATCGVLYPVRVCQRVAVTCRLHLVIAFPSNKDCIPQSRSGMKLDYLRNGLRMRIKRRAVHSSIKVGCWNRQRQKGLC